MLNLASKEIIINIMLRSKDLDGSVSLDRLPISTQISYELNVVDVTTTNLSLVKAVKILSLFIRKP